MSISERLAAHRASASSVEPPKPKNPDDLNDDQEGQKTKPNSRKKETEMTDDEINALKADSKAEGVKEANARMNAVFASDNYAGREKLAHSLLATSLTADEINTQLAAAPKIEASALTAPVVSQEQSDAQARQVMLDAIASNVNAPISLGGGASPEAEAKALADPEKGAASMKSAMAKANELTGY